MSDIMCYIGKLVSIYVNLKATLKHNRDIHYTVMMNQVSVIDKPIILDNTVTAHLQECDMREAIANMPR